MRKDTFDEDALIRQVEKICESPEFQSKPVLCRFLSYIVSETLAGRGDNLKAFTIGVDVFDKDEDFDPGQDTLVRINAIRLRRSLDMYYSKTGKMDQLHIEIPKGGYVPEFGQRSSPAISKRQAIGQTPGRLSTTRRSNYAALADGPWNNARAGSPAKQRYRSIAHGRDHSPLDGTPIRHAGHPGPPPAQAPG